MVDLLGAWSLLSCTNIRGEDAATAYGDPPAGQIQYTADGRMSAFLMDPAWVERGNQLADGFTEFFSYGGTWKRDGDSITHHVMFSSHPQRVGSSFVRNIHVIDDDTMELATNPEVSRSGRVYVTRLRWRRVKAGA